MKLNFTNSLVTIALLITTGICFSQSGEENNFNSYFVNPLHNPNVIPQTPNAASFKIYGDTPVNTSTGLPSVNIPIYTFEVDGVQVPISLSYHASGIKVDDISSIVGLKWTLNTGGGIFRVVRDVDDFGEDIHGSYGWIRNTPTNKLEEWIVGHPTHDFSTQFGQDTFSQDVLENHDELPDEFNYNFLGYSGDFIFKTSGEVFKSNKDGLSIVGGSAGFVVEDQMGNMYEFIEKESNSKFTYFFTEATTNFNVESSTETTGWMLNHITTKNGKGITFEYEDYEYNYEMNRPSQQLVTSQFCDYLNCVYPAGCEGEGSLSYLSHVVKSTNTLYETKNRLTKKIYTDFVEVIFNYIEGSLPNTSISGWDKRIDEIVIIDKVQNKEKKFKFKYGTYSGDKRLRLEEVIEIGFDNAEMPPYKFNYYSGDLPSFNSFSKDYKGYFNGKNNASLLPKTVFSLNRTYPHGPNLSVHPKYDLLADRYFDINFLKIGALKEIIYPTGGKTEFEYEPNAIGLNPEEAIIIPITKVVNTDSDNTSTNPVPLEYLFSELVQIDNFAGKIVIKSTGDCPNCGQQAYNVPRIAMYKWNGTSINDDPTNASNVGDVIFNTSIESHSYTPFPAGPLDNGIYLIQLQVPDGSYNQNDFINVELSWHQKEKNREGDIALQQNYFGGLRIKSLKDIDENDNEYNETIYTYFEGIMGDEFSSSRLFKSGLSGGLGETGQDIYSSDIIYELGASPSNGYVYTKVKKSKHSTYNNGQVLEYYEPRYSFSHIQGGDLLRKEVYNNLNELINIIEYEYEKSNPLDENLKYQFTIPSSVGFQFSITHICEYPDDPFTPYIIGSKNISGHDSSYGNYQYYGKWSVKSKAISTQYLKTGGSIYHPVTTINEYAYNDDLLITYEKTDTQFSRVVDGTGEVSYDMTHPNGEVIEVEYTYKSDYPGEQSLTSLPIGLPISKEVKNNGQKIQGQYFVYDSYGNIKTTYHFNKGQGSNNSPLSYIPSEYEEMNSYVFQQGKPVQIRVKDGVGTSYIYGYNNQYPVVKLENKFYSTINPTLITNIKNATNATVVNETTLNNAFTALRNAYPNVMISTYVYNPMVGVTTITGPNGDRIHYVYDGFGRLDHIKDKYDNLIEEYEYNYGNQ